MQVEPIYQMLTRKESVVTVLDMQQCERQTFSDKTTFADFSHLPPL